MRRVVLIVWVVLTGCVTKNNFAPTPHIDTTPLGCGYNWFQAGYSPTREFDCKQKRNAIRESELLLANESAWTVARARCPVNCQPREIQDSIESVDRFPQGVCRNGVLYFSTRIYFSCGAGL